MDERDVLLDEARRLILTVKEQMGEHGDPDSENVQAWLSQTGDWLHDHDALVAADG